MTTRDDTGPISLVDQGQTRHLPALTQARDALYVAGAYVGARRNARPGSERKTLYTRDPFDSYSLVGEPDFGLNLEVKCFAHIPKTAEWSAHDSLVKRESTARHVVVYKALVGQIASFRIATSLSESGRSPRSQLVVAAQPAIVDRVRKALQESTVDWRTPPSLADELEVSEIEVRKALESMGDAVRQPIAASGDELNYFRLSERGKTWQERLRWVLLAIGRTPPNKLRQ